MSDGVHDLGKLNAALGAPSTEGEELERLRAENKRLRAALEPFARWAEDAQPDPDSEKLLSFDPNTATVSDLRRARAALSC